MRLTQDRVNNLLIYSLVALANILAIALSAALATGAMPGFRDGEFLAPAKAEMAGLLGILVPILSAWVAANRPSFGGEGLAAQAGVYRQEGYHRDEMVVLPRDRVPAAAAVAGADRFEYELTGIQLQQVANELERRMKAETVKTRQASPSAASLDPIAALDDERKAEGRG
jgi:hypothetical protein